MVSRQYKNRLLTARIIFEKGFPVMVFVLAAKQPTPTILKNRASSHQIIMFVHVVCALVCLVICSYRNLSVNNDFGFQFFSVLTVSVKRIEKTKNRVKSDLEATIKAIDSKHMEIFSAIESADSNRKKWNLLFNILV